MPIIADFLGDIPPSPTIVMTEKARALKAEGHQVISLSVGEPDFDTPLDIKESAKQALDAGQTKYTPVAGIQALKEAVIERYKQTYNLNYQPAQTIVSAGAKHVLFNALFSTINPGDEVIIPAPYWVSYPSMVALSKGISKVVVGPENKGFKLQAKDLAAAITPKTKWVILNSPSNPTGAVYTAEEWRALGDVLVKNPHVWVMVDDIYEDLIYGNQAFSTFLQAVPELKDRTLIVSGVSKGFAMTGWRIGYGLGPEVLIKAMSKVQSHSTSGVCAFAQAGAVTAVKKGADKNQITLFQKRRDVLVVGLNGIDGLSCNVPDGAFYVYVNCQQAMKAKGFDTDTDLAVHLLEQAHVATVPGSAFGLSGFLRISYAVAEDTLKEAINRLKKVLT
jgi:aspartate aminotransferase